MQRSIIPTPRHVTCTHHDVYNGNTKQYTWDHNLISVHNSFHDDVLMLQNVFEGNITSSEIYPLVFDTKTNYKEISLRSVEFYREVDQNNDIYRQLSLEEKHCFLIGVRDLFIASCRGILSEEEKNLLKRIVEIIDPSEDDESIVRRPILNMNVTPYPTRSNKVVRFIPQDANATEEQVIDECFARNELSMIIGFVDPCELSYHNFENIMDLDSLFDKNFDRFKITNVTKHADSDVYLFDVQSASSILISRQAQLIHTATQQAVKRRIKVYLLISDPESESHEMYQHIHERHTHCR